MSSPSPFGFDFIASKTASQSDTDDIKDGMPVGLHVAGSSGYVKVSYAIQDADGSDVEQELYINQGDFVKFPLKRVWSTVSGSPAATGIKVLYGKLRDYIPNEE